MTAALAQPELPLDDTDLPALIVLGRDDSARVHASWFDATEVGPATAAAKLMGMMTLAVDTGEVRALADQLPHGKIFGSGKAFVPFVKAALYDQLVAHVPLKDQVRPLRLVKLEAATAEAEGGGTAPEAPQAQRSGKTPPLTMPANWSGIVPGSVVLATEGLDDGWWAAVVTNIDGHLANLKWREYGDMPSFVRPVTELAMLHPSRPVTA